MFPAATLSEMNTFQQSSQCNIALQIGHGLEFMHTPANLTSGMSAPFLVAVPIPRTLLPPEPAAPTEYSGNLINLAEVLGQPIAARLQVGQLLAVVSKYPFLHRM